MATPPAAPSGTGGAWVGPSAGGSAAIAGRTSLGSGGSTGALVQGGGGSDSTAVAGAASAPAAASSGQTAGSAAAGGGSQSEHNEQGETDTHFSFFVTSYAAMQRLSGSPDGFGGDLRFGQADGLSGADEICRQIAEYSLPGSGSKGWRAFLSVTKGSGGTPVNAIDRIGEGPWYDRLGRLVAANKADLAQTRPVGADPAIIDDLPNEDGVPNHAPDGMEQVDNHDILTGSSATGMLYSTDWSSTCHDWTSSQGSGGRPRVGHSWPRTGGGGPGGGRQGGGGPSEGGGPGGSDMANWMSALDEAGCAAGASLVEMGPPDADNPSVGSGGGYGGIYCFALTP